jgi:hypothetical protein
LDFHISRWLVDFNTTLTSYSTVYFY